MHQRHSTILLVLAAVLCCSSAGNPVNNTDTKIQLPNVDCKPRIYPVHTDPQSSQYNPQIVHLHRCNGTIGNSSTKFTMCTADKVETVKILVSDISDENNKHIISMLNHTSCKRSCILSSKDCSIYAKWREESCQCICQPQPHLCSKQHIFKSANGQCGCYCRNTHKCDDGRVWDGEKCDCQCKKVCPTGLKLDSDICQCVATPSVSPAKNVGVACTGGVSMTVLFVALGVEAAIFIVLCLWVYISVRRKYRRRNAKHNRIVSDAGEKGRIHTTRT